MKNSPLPIGITGGIGAGKSIACKVFALLGIPVYNADLRAKWLMNNDHQLKDQIVDVFGPEAYKDEQIDREYLAKNVFHQPESLNQLNALVHPAVAIDYEKWHHQQSAPYTLKEAALLFEAGSFRQLYSTILVTAPASLRIQRVLSRDPHRTEKDVQAIIDNQWPEEKKRQLAGFIIENDETRMIIPQILEIHCVLLDTH